jgi:hypothetical protein
LLRHADHLATIRPSDGDMSNESLPLPEDGKGISAGDSGKDVFDRTRDFITRFVAVTVHEAIAIALWIMMCHAIGAFDCVGYLMIVSAEKGTGKTRLLEVLRLLVPRPWLIGRAPAITMALTLDRERVTLLLDETDAAFTSRSTYTETLRGILDAGYLRNGTITTRKDGEPIDLSVFGPKALAGIGRLPGTIAHRSIPINLQRKLPSDNIERFREKRAVPEAELIKADLQLFGEWFASQDHPEPKGLDGLGDRAADISEPLLQIEECCGDDVAAVAQEAILALCNPATHEEPSPGVDALNAVRELFDETFRRPELFEQNTTIRKLRSSDIAKKLGVSEKMVSKTLEPYGIRPQAIRFGPVSVRGYYAQFEAAWQRYTTPATTATL